MRVLVVCDWFLKYGVEQTLALQRHAEVALLCRNQAHEFGGNHQELLSRLNRVQEAGIPLFLLPGRVLSRESALSLPQLRRAIKAWRPDIVHAHDNTDPRLLILLSGWPKVLTIHDPLPHPGATFPKGLGRRVIRDAWIHRARRVVVHGNSLADAMAERLPRRLIAVVPHGVPLASSALPTPRHPTVLFFGRLEPYKGLDVLARSMPYVWKQRSESRFVIAGQGPSAADVPVDPRVEARIRYIPEAELPSLLEAASVVVLPYTEASQSGVGALAIGAGVPVVATDVGGLPELVHDPAYLVPADNPAALAHALLAALAAGDASRTRVLEHARTLSWAAAAERSFGVYREILDEVP